MKSINQQLERVRKPRVHIQYEVETATGVEQRELPFIVGVLGDFTGDRESKPLTERRFIKIDRDNFNQVMAQLAPKLHLRVDNVLEPQQAEATELPLTLAFNCLEDFEPDRLVEQVPQLSRLMAIRNQLQALLAKADRSHELETLLEQLLQDEPALQALMHDLEQSDQP